MLAQTVTVLAAEEGGGGLDLLLPTTNELVAGIIAFALVFIVIWRFALPQVNAAMVIRQEAVTSRLAEADQARTEAETLLADYRAQLANAKARQVEIIDEARVAAEALRADVVAKANAEAEQIVGKAREEAAAEKARVLADARSDVANLSIDLAERVVGGSLDRAAQLGLVERYLTELER